MLDVGITTFIVIKYVHQRLLRKKVLPKTKYIENDISLFERKGQTMSQSRNTNIAVSPLDIQIRNRLLL